MNFFNISLSDKTCFLKGGLIKGLYCFLGVFGLISLLLIQVSLVYSRSHSVPYHFFLNLKQATPQRGHYTCFYSPWYGGKVIKKVVGREGDALSYDDEGNLWIVVVNLKERLPAKHILIGKYKEFARDGRKLTPIKTGIIPKGKVFVTGEHERSFDSRYEELGLISEQELKGRLIALI